MQFFYRRKYANNMQIKNTNFLGRFDSQKIRKKMH
jgi:hypothetical protein